MAINIPPLFAEKVMCSILDRIHKDGPTNLEDFETLAHMRLAHPRIFIKYEQRLLFLLGLFYKVGSPKDLLETAYHIFSNAIEEKRKTKLTPTQASIYNAIDENKVFSFSAPTSTGKSHLFRNIIKNTTTDIVIIVPSRALISEYMSIIQNTVDKNVLVLQFVENINKANLTRRVYVLTPERAKDLFRRKSELNIELFLIDEAQDLDDPTRELRFDALIKRLEKHFPSAKKIFAHPFVDNPEGQIKRHSFGGKAAARSFKQNAVGKIYLELKKNGKLKCFSPFCTTEKKYDFGVDILSDFIKRNGTILVYTSKNKIYKGNHIKAFPNLISLCPKLTDPNALKYIEELEDFIGSKDRESEMIEKMKYGIVIHHGSMPLKARLIIERFVNASHARICFATPTLLQGINMPFDAVFIDTFKNLDSLSMKNLIGRAGRSKEGKRFDIGYVVIKDGKISDFTRLMNETSRISEQSRLNTDVSAADEDDKDLIEAIKNDTFNDELNLTQSQLARLENTDIKSDISYALDCLFKDDGTLLSGQEYYKLNKRLRDKLKECIGNIYAAHLRRPLERTEKAILSAAIPILLWQIQGKSFKVILALRHGFLTNEEDRRRLEKMLKNKEISEEAYETAIKEHSFIKGSQTAHPIPNKRLKYVPLFDQKTHIDNLNYDVLVYDTYDYIDKVISLSLSDPICAAFLLFFKATGDLRALHLNNYIRYGTNSTVEIMLLRYGFAFEDVEWIKKHVENIDENKIIFKNTIKNLEVEKYKVIERFVF